MIVYYCMTLLRWQYTIVDIRHAEHSAVNRVVVGSSPTRGAYQNISL